jgi:C-terminal processing protease CtpA/Prc
MHELSINRDSVDWAMVEESAFRSAAAAETPAGTYAAIRLALNHLNDQHSIFLTPTQAATFQHGEAVFTTPVVEIRSDDLGYVSVGQYLGDIGDQADEYAADLAAQIDSLTENVCGWIMDLQSNSGGNMWPMLAGVAPLLTPGTVGSFTYPDGTTETWENTGTMAIWNDVPMTTNSRPNPNHEGLPVAVLISTHTGSSGEAIAIAFHGQEASRFFGQPTAGLTTSNEPVELSDGAIIALTMSNFTDRLDRQYGQNTPIEPDHTTAGFTESENSAVEWLHTQPTCSP